MKNILKIITAVLIFWLACEIENNITDGGGHFPNIVTICALIIAMVMIVINYNELTKTPE